MGGWIAVLAWGGCNLATNAVLPSSDQVVGDSGSTPTDAEDVLLSEIVDNGLLKFVELYNGTGAPIDLAGYELRRYANGDVQTDSTLALDGNEIPAGATFVISGDPARYALEYGGPADLAAPNTIEGNGDDVYELVYAIGTAIEVIDVYGEVGVDGTGTDWDYDGVSAQRLDTVVAGRTVWRSSEWDMEPWESASPGER